MSIKLTILMIVILQIINLTIQDKPYQVIIWLKNDYYKKPIGKPLCNGIVIHERLILTTATCLRNTTNILNNNNNNNINSDNEDNENIINTTNLTKPAVIELTTTESNILSSSTNNNNLKFIQLNASDIIILGGNYNINTQNQKPIISNISEIEIVNNFNLTTLENDIALLNLNESLPLSMRRDIQWISLDDHTAYKNTSCKISFSNFMTKNTQETFTVKLMNNQNCTNATNFKSTRKSDICSLYVNPSICNLSDNHLMTSDDRGTGLVCDSKLIGILSQIIPIDNETECSNFKPFKAIYTRVANHLNWIYEKIAIESMADLGKSNYILAPQYKESAPSPSIHMPQEPQLLEKSSSTPVVSMSTDRTIKTSQDIDSSLPSNFENRTGTETKTNNKSETQTTKTGLGKSIGVLSKTICLPALSISIIISVLISKY